MGKLRSIATGISIFSNNSLLAISAWTTGNFVGTGPLLVVVVLVLVVVAVVVVTAAVVGVLAAAAPVVVVAVVVVAVVVGRATSETGQFSSKCLLVLGMAKLKGVLTSAERALAQEQEVKLARGSLMSTLKS
jgi:hypothetical protein